MYLLKGPWVWNEFNKSLPPKKRNFETIMEDPGNFDVCVMVNGFTEFVCFNDAFMS